MMVYEMMRNNAELSKAAKEAGDPEQLMDHLISKGKTELIPVVRLVFLAGSATTVDRQKDVRLFRNKREKTKQKAEGAWQSYSKESRSMMKHRKEKIQYEGKRNQYLH